MPGDSEALSLTHKQIGKRGEDTAVGNNGPACLSSAEVEVTQLSLNSSSSHP